MSAAEGSRQFSPDDAGQRVGWVAIARGENDLVEVCVTSAVVGEAGAEIVYTGRDRRAVLPGDRVNLVRGFEAAVSVGTTIMASSGIRAPEHIATSNPGLSANMLLDLGVLTAIPDAHKVWTPPEDSLLGHLERSLYERGLEEHYPFFYYLLNHSAMHVDLRPTDVPTKTGEEWLMPDPAMYECTGVEYAQAQMIRLKLERIRNQLRIVHSPLTHRYPEAAEAERQRAQSEIDKAIRSITLQVRGMVVPDYVYDPTGSDVGMVEAKSEFARKGVFVLAMLERAERNILHPPTTQAR